MVGIARVFGVTVAACTLLLSPAARAAESTEFRISRQPSILYLQQVLMEDGKLIEKHAAKMGMPDLAVRWLTLTSGGVSTDALLAGQLDIVTSGVSNLLLAWGKTNGAIKGVTAVAGLPMQLVTRSPNVKTLADFGPNDRIAVPTLKVSMQATILGIALEKLYGPGGHTKLDAQQVQLGHPDAAAAILNPMHEVNSHLAPPPYDTMELKAPGAHAVMNSIDVLGGPATITASFAAVKFVEAKPDQDQRLSRGDGRGERRDQEGPRRGRRCLSARDERKDQQGGIAARHDGAGCDFLSRAAAHADLCGLHAACRHHQTAGEKLEGLFHRADARARGELISRTESTFPNAKRSGNQRKQLLDPGSACGRPGTWCSDGV